MAKTDQVAPIGNTNLSVESLRDITDFDAAIRALTDAGVELRHVSDEMGDGFALVDDKEPLVGVPFVVLSSNLSDGDYGRMVTLRIITKDGRKLIMNDGSTGLCAQAQEYEQRTGGTLAGLVVERGLRGSQFKYCTQCVKVSKKNATECSNCGAPADCLKPGTTYYLDTAAAS